MKKTTLEKIPNEYKGPSFNSLPIEIQNLELFKYADPINASNVALVSRSFFNSPQKRLYWQAALRELPVNQTVLDTIFSKAIIRNYQHLYYVLSKNMDELNLSPHTEEWEILLASGEVPAINEAIRNAKIPSIQFTETLISEDSSSDDEEEEDDDEIAKAQKKKYLADEKKISTALMIVLLAGKAPGVECLVKHLDFTKRNPEFSTHNYQDFCQNLKYACASGDINTIETFCQAGQILYQRDEAYGKYPINKRFAADVIWANISMSDPYPPCSPFLNSLIFSGKTDLLKHYYSAIQAKDKEFGEERAVYFLRSLKSPEMKDTAFTSGSLSMIEFLLNLDPTYKATARTLESTGASNNLAVVKYAEDLLIKQDVLFLNPKTKSQIMENIYIYYQAIDVFIKYSNKQGVEYLFSKMMKIIELLPKDEQEIMRRDHGSQFLNTVVLSTSDFDTMLKFLIDKFKLNPSSENFKTAFSMGNKNCMRLLKNHLEAANEFTNDMDNQGLNLFEWIFKRTYSSLEEVCDMIRFMRSIGFDPNAENKDFKNSFESLDESKDELTPTMFNEIKQSLTADLGLTNAEDDIPEVSQKQYRKK